MSAALEPEPSDRAMAAGDWCRRIAEGALSDAQVDAFEAWMAGDPENRAAFDRASFIWRALDGRAAPPELVSIRMDALSALQRPSPLLNDDVDEAPPPRRWRSAAGGAVAAVAMLLLVFLLNPRVEPAGPVEFATRQGERRVVMLDDGSRLSLDAASKVDVAYSSERRSLTLRSGRAKFDVAKNALRPFSVIAGDKLVVATGTSFSVEILNGEVNVTLYEGQVAVLDARTRKPAMLSVRAKGVMPAEQVLEPGKALSLGNAGGARITAIDPGRSVAWEGGQLSFTDEPLAVAVERMNRYSSVPLRIDDAEAGKIPISGVFNGDDTDGFLAGITGVFPVKSERANGRIVLKGAQR